MSDPYYSLDEDWDLIVASFQSQYGIRLTREIHSMKWHESLEVGIDDILRFASRKDHIDQSRGRP